ncbi:MFS transporter [Streptomyces sp. TRM68367]|uniref:MFS transporter n=1 Tax=Streptomyces sp. TRM68367 TaxID=2758415 RepID=UPI00165C9004|nr:MFS transporter [Streptomyces sp. TRM68367]MBC9724557.1 MFS transporter [Streptomyces sp. TRM68367]
MTLVEDAETGGGPAADSTTAEEAGPDRPLRRNRDFLLLWSGASLSFLAARVTAVAYPLIVLWHTGSPLAMSVVSTAALLPLLLVQLPAGALVDRWDRRRLMLVCEAGRLVAVGSVALALAAGRMTVAHLAASAFVEASLAVFYRLAERGAVRNLVHPAHLPTALAQNEARGRAAGLLGQPGGVLLQSAARWLPFGFGALGYLVSLLSLLLIHKDFQQERADRTGRRRMVTEVAEGMRWLWRQRFLRAALGYVAGTNVLFQMLALALILRIKEAGLPSATLAVVVGIGGVGGLCGALAGGWIQRRMRQRTLLIGGAVAWALLIGAMGFTSEPVLLGALYAGTGFVGAVFNVGASVYQVRTTPDALQGRVAATAGIIGSGTNALGSFAAGLLLAAWGAKTTVRAIAAAMVVLALFAVLAPDLKGEITDDGTDTDTGRATGG